MYSYLKAIYILVAFPPLEYFPKRPSRISFMNYKAAPGSICKRNQSRLHNLFSYRQIKIYWRHFTFNLKNATNDQQHFAAAKSLNISTMCLLCFSMLI